VLALALPSPPASAPPSASLRCAASNASRDKSFNINLALGVQGTVYLGIPARRTGAGKVHLKMHDRLVELAAVTTDDDIPTGTEVLVVDTFASDTVIVTRAQPLLSEINDVQ
jgi:hypothetical protein